MIKILATDLDGTLIPLDGVKENESDLQQLKTLLEQRQIEIIFVTGRHIESVQQVIADKALPLPEFIIADVGSSIYRRHIAAPNSPTANSPIANSPTVAPGSAISQWQPLREYEQLLDAIMSASQRESILHISSQFQELTPQEDEKQGRHKISFYVDAEKLQTVSQSFCAALEKSQLPFSIISSVDPFNGDGLIDILPEQVTKSFALRWLIKFKSLTNQEVIFAGDSGNDYAAMIGGFNTIVVGNAPDHLRTKVGDFFRSQDLATKLVCVDRYATSGVLEGVGKLI